MKKTTKQNKTWFLETSVHINRFFGHSLFQREIEATIGTQLCYTSFFVLYEYNRSVIRTLINFYYHVLEEEWPADAIAYYKESFGKRENKILIGALSILVSEGDLTNNKQKLIANLESLITVSLRKFHDSIVGFVTDQVKCPLAEASIDTSYEEFIEQIKCEAKCNIAEFWKKNRGILKLLTQEQLSEIHRKNKGFTDMLPLLRKVLDDCEVGQSIRNCSKLADAIIAIEMPKEHTMLTFDRSFESLCPLMRKEVRRLPSLSELRRQSRNNQKR